MDNNEQRRTLDVTVDDLDALDCPLCFSPFDARIFQSTRRSSATTRRARAPSRPGCGYAGLGLRDHIQGAHAGGDVVSFAGSAAVTLRRGAAFVVLLQETDARVFLLLNGGDVPSGRSLSVVCVGPRLAGNKSLEYELRVVVVGGGGAGMSGSLSLSASGPVACTRLWAGHHPMERFLFVPDAYWSSSGGVSVTVHVRKLNCERQGQNR
nr:unnamed protein product [Digitaria exilis]